MRTFSMGIKKKIEVINMNKNAYMDIEHSIVQLYNDMKWILNSKRGKNFQFMMLNKSFEALFHTISQIRDKYEKSL